MSEAVLVALVGYGVTLLVAFGGWIFGYRIHRQAQRLGWLEGRIVKLESEVRARIALEKASCHWLAELTGRTPESVKRELRNRSQERSGLRPKLSNSDLSTPP